jgi:hypothetical protein
MAKLGKNGWWFDSTPGKAVFTRRQPGGWTQRKEVSGVVFRSHFQGGVPEPSHAAEVGPSGVTRLDTVQIISKCENDEEGKWRLDRDLRDRERIVQIARQLRELGHEDAAERMERCGIIIGRQVCKKCGLVGEFKKWECANHFLCPRCDRIRAKKRQKDLRRSTGIYKPEPGCRWKMVSVTIGTKGQYKAALVKISQNFGTLWTDVLTHRWEEVLGEPRERNGKFYMGRFRVFPDDDGGWWLRTAKVKGAGFRSTEFGPLTGNVHGHALVCIPWIPKGVIVEEWKRLTGNIIIDIRQITPKPGGDAVTMADAIAEVSKYITKPAAVPLDRLIDFWIALKGHQITQIYGGLRGIAKEDVELDFHCECGCSNYLWEYVRREDGDPCKPRGPPCK